MKIDAKTFLGRAEDWWKPIPEYELPSAKLKGLMLPNKH